MSIKDLMIIGYDNAIGLKLLDTTTGHIVRETRQACFTDRIRNLYSEGDYIWAADTDNVIACYTKDLVLVGRVDIGYYATAFNYANQAFYIDGAHLYTITTRKHDNLAIPENANQLVLRKFDKVSLQSVAEFALTDPELWDAVTYNRTVNTGSVVWGPGFVWVQSSVADQAHWKKISLIDGSVVDVWDTGPTSITPFYNNAHNALEWMCSFDASSLVGTYSIANFASKSLSAPIAYDINAAAIAAGTAWDGVNTNGNLVYPDSKRLVNVDFEAGTYKALATWNVWNSENAGNGVLNWCEITIQLQTGVVSISPSVSNLGKYLHDDAKANILAGDAHRFFTAQGGPYLSDGRWLLENDTQGWGVVDFTNQTLTITGEPWIQGYSSDAQSTAALRIMQFNESILTSTVTQSGAAAVGRNVYLYDLASGDKIDQAVTDSTGTYVLKKYTSRPAFVVAESAGVAENFKINAFV